MVKAAVKITRDLAHPEAAGKYQRIICMTGKNKGLCYYLNDKRVIMGRSNQADIQIIDTQASREHLELVKVGKDYVLTDLGSQNGVMVNDLKVKQHKLKNGDKIIVGSTVFKFSFIDVLPPAVIDEDDEDEDDDDELEDEYEEVEEKKPKKKKKKKAPSSPEEKRKKLIYGLVAIAGIAMFLPSDDEAPKPKAAKKDAAVVVQDTTRKRSNTTALEKEIQDKIEAYIHRGRREAREQNYFRAMEEFQLALLLDPTNGDAAFNMNKAKQRLDEKIESMFLQATKYKDALKYHQALGTYCSIYKLLKEYPEDERFIEADKSVKDMADKIGKDESENHCF
ncbi:FHA domain-containing protein [Bacteriovorax sp. DB6_IX]|uniref:FHA domain-containing protein n=1 Tax=Bacteriovorax sp. DB6_IX TaxID=1353530 RepID=UPI00038A2EBB|nr:FHA domain-containing protein [Bacteriovorax sp. DB6_IX]EQC51272.1 FHA domain protein [Bacteriovorax sp. DB6_IX]